MNFYSFDTFNDFKNLNQKAIPVNNIPVNDKGMMEFNDLVDSLKEELKYGFEKTNSGCIKKVRKNLNRFEIEPTNVSVQIILVLMTGAAKFQFKNSTVIDDAGNEFSGTQAFRSFTKILKDYGINIEDYAITNGPEVKKSIEKPYIQMEKDYYIDRRFFNANHIDFHSSYPAGLANTHPEFRPVLEDLYNKRKEDPMYKAILNLSIRYMQTLNVIGFNARYAHLAKDAIADNNRRVEDIAERLRKSGRIVISYNTDGVWYDGETYHGEGEGPNLGQWSNDHVNCMFRAKSAGAYEFIEDGKYYPVVRGQTTLDAIKPRSSWEWGDIYKSSSLQYYYNPKDMHIYRKEED